MLVEKLESFVSQWPRSHPKQKVVVLASARKQVGSYIHTLPSNFYFKSTSQVELLKKEVAKKRLNCDDKPCEVTVIPTFRIQGV